MSFHHETRLNLIIIKNWWNMNSDRISQWQYLHNMTVRPMNPMWINARESWKWMRWDENEDNEASGRAKSMWLMLASMVPRWLYTRRIYARGVKNLKTWLLFCNALIRVARTNAKTNAQYQVVGYKSHQSHLLKTEHSAVVVATPKFPHVSF